MTFDGQIEYQKGQSRQQVPIDFISLNSFQQVSYRYVGTGTCCPSNTYLICHAFTGSSTVRVASKNLTDDGPLFTGST
jgi:homoserine acetyltransferase